MIKTEKRRIEKYLFDTLPEALIPIEVTYRSGRLKIEAFRRIKRIAKEFYRLFRNNPFSSEAKAFIHEKIKNDVEKWGYFTDDLNEGHIITYLADRVKDELILDSTVKISSGEGYINLTDYELENADSEGNECYFVTVLDNKIVSVCETNSRDAFLGAKEINVYTAEEYRGKGYGASNVSAMIKHYLSLGHNVAYTSRRDNTASCTLAEKCGLTPIAETYYYVCYKGEEDGI